MFPVSHPMMMPALYTTRLAKDRTLSKFSGFIGQGAASPFNDIVNVRDSLSKLSSLRAGYINSFVCCSKHAYFSIHNYDYRSKPSKV